MIFYRARIEKRRAGGFMKKKLTIFVSLILVLVLMFSLSACTEVEYGSKVQRMKMVLTYTDAEGTEVERNVTIKLYKNLAPLTVEHFIKLAEEGYYDGTVVSNLQSNWFEFGGYKYDENGKLAACDQDVSTVTGEFSLNGWLNNPLKSSNVGALVMKRNYSLDTDTKSAYDTAKSTVIVTLGSVSRFKTTEYCYFGLIDNEAESYTVTDSTSDSVATASKTSLDACKALPDYRENDDGVTVYYYETTGEYYSMKKYTDDGNSKTEYYKGLELTDENLLEDEALEDFNKIRNDTQKSYFLLTVPYTKITIKSIRKA